MKRILAALIFTACGSSAAPPAAAPVFYDGGTPPVMKVCNPLYATGGRATTLTFSIGQPPVAFTATSGTCTPTFPDLCRAIPAGPAVPGVLLDEGGKVIVTGTLTLLPSTEYLFHTTVDETGTYLDVTGGIVPVGSTCAGSDPLARDGGVPDATTD